jgi:TctA family transporter
MEGLFSTSENNLHSAKNMKNKKRTWPAKTLTIAYALSSLGTWVRSTSTGVPHGQLGTGGANAGAAGG